VSVPRAIQALGLTESQYVELRRMLPARKLEAVKRYHEITNFSLAEARAAIDAIEAGAVPGGGPPIASRPGWEQADQPDVNAVLPSASPAEARSIAALVARLPPGSRTPTRSEALAIGVLAAKGDVDQAAMQIGAGWGVDGDSARRIAIGLRPRGTALGGLFFVLAMGLVMGLLGVVAWMAFR